MHESCNFEIGKSGILRIFNWLCNKAEDTRSDNDRRNSIALVINLLALF